MIKYEERGPKQRKINSLIGVARMTVQDSKSDMLLTFHTERICVSLFLILKDQYVVKLLLFLLDLLDVKSTCTSFV